MTFRRSNHRSAISSCLSIIRATGSLVLLFTAEPGVIDEAYAEVAPPITSSGLNTTVTQSGNTYNITGGTRPDNGVNLFHSFGDFNVPTNSIANFLNQTPNLETSNILGRVTGGNPSNIFGTIQTTGFDNANLFLINPAGFLFGPSATVNVGGMVNFTSADYLKLADGARFFNAIPNVAADALLSASPVAAFGFLGSNPGAITVQGSQFTLSEGPGISLVGGNLTVEGGTPEGGALQPAHLSTTGGQINLASVASPGEALVTNFLPEPGMMMGNISLSQGSTLDASGPAAGTVRIRGGQFMIADATLSADTGNFNGAPVAIDINLTGDLIISDTRAIPAISATTSGIGNAGMVDIVSANMEATSTDPGFALFALIATSSLGDGRAGNVNITTGNLNVTGPAGTWHFIDSGIQGPGPGGHVTVTAQTIDLQGTTISTGTQLAELFGLEPSGPAGNITFNADALQTNTAFLLTTAAASLIETQVAGNVELNVPDINMVFSGVSALGNGAGGNITINGDTLVSNATQFDTFTALTPGQGITFTGRILELTNGSTWATSTAGKGAAGDIHITASDHLSLIGITGTNPLGEFNPSGLFSNSLGDFGQGPSGDIFVTTLQLTMTEGRINTSTASSGLGGNVTINADAVTISGEFSNADLVEPFFTVTNVHPSGIFTQTVGTDLCVGPCGNAGSILANIDSLVMGPGSQINSGTSNNGLGGTITINAANTISMSGTLSNGEPVGIFSRTIGIAPGSEDGGNIALTAGQSVTLTNGSSVSASSTGPGNTGNIQIDAGNQFVMTDSSVTTEANFASGGTIKITTTPSGTVELSNSTISASVLDGTGGGGSVDIDPQYVLLQNSQILAQAVQGPGGNITINITNGGLFLADANSTISASSQFGVNGTVTIQSPNAPVSGEIQPLGKTPLIATSLLNQHCAALAGEQFSSFTVAGRDSLPTEPGNWLASPLYAAGIGPRLKAEGERLESMRASAGQGLPDVVRVGLAAHQIDQTNPALLSLRQIAPAGFLTQSFAVEGLTSCTS